MIQRMGRTALEGMMEGMEGIRDGSGRWIGKLGARNPWARRSWTGSLAARPGLTAFLSVLAALTVAGIVMYLRKKRQVTAHYTMGESGAAWEGGPIRNPDIAETAETVRT